MTNFNYTYNYNMDTPSFGQSLLYSAASTFFGTSGSLFNGGGCNMGGNMPFNMGTSIFGGFGCYGGSYNSTMGAILGQGIAQIANIGLGALINRNAGNGAPGAAESGAKAIEAKAEADLKVLNQDGEYFSLNSSFETHTPEQKYTDAVDNALKAIDDRLREIGNPTKPQQPVKDANESAEDFQKRKDDYNKKLEEYNKLIEEQRQLADKTDTNNPLVKKYLEAKDAFDKRQAAIENAIENLKPLKAEYAKLIESGEISRSDKEMKMSEYNTLFRRSGERTLDDGLDKDTYIAGAKKAMYLFKKYKDDSTSKLMYAKDLVALFDKIGRDEYLKFSGGEEIYQEARKLIGTDDNNE